MVTAPEHEGSGEHVEREEDGGAGGEHALLPLARRVARQLSAAPGVSSCFLAGSITARLGNHTSDVDVYLTGRGGPVSRRQLSVDRTRFDVQRLPVEELGAAVDRVSGAAFPSEGGTVLAQRDLDLAVRLWTGEPVTDGGDLGALLDRLRAAELPLRRVVIAHWLTAVHYELEDVAGLAASADLDAALMSARTSLLLAGKAVAAAAGDLYNGRKWVWRQLRRSAPDRFPQEVFRRSLRYDPPGGGPGAEPAAFTQTCLAVASTLGWHGVPLTRWPDWHGGTGPLRRAPGFSPRPYDDGVVLALPALRRVRLTSDAALVWALCHGVSRDAVADRAGALRDSDPAYARLDATRCVRLVDQLIDSRLVEAR